MEWVNTPKLPNSTCEAEAGGRGQRTITAEKRSHSDQAGLAHIKDSSRRPWKTRKR